MAALDIDEPVYIDAVEFKITEPEYFYVRQIFIRKQFEQAGNHSEASITIDSKSSLHYNIGEIKSTELWEILMKTIVL
jgi:hypothetical protein